MADLTRVGTSASTRPHALDRPAAVSRERSIGRDAGGGAGEPTRTDAVRRGEDRVELSVRAGAPEGARTELVGRLRAEIASGAFDNDARIGGAVDAMLKGNVLDLNG